MTSFERAPWWYVVVLWIIMAYRQLPVLVRREEYERLKDQDHVIKRAVEVLAENRKLRMELREAKGLKVYDE